MFFKSLELIGFKSFADKTTIDFQSGVTAIVGPNGCGKSNISDAIRWVLGEQSAKSLRGGSMEDVIFNGSSVKEALNFAEVSLTLANHSRILPIDYDEVTISRRLYRSGESEYLLNKNEVRLRDVHELLMGTGIGTESYSIIEQGKMDVILNSKPDDRRQIFEEAAGITKFKSQKKEALRKLEQTDQNLLRVNDIIQEVRRQIGSIERQAKKAEVYKIEFEKLKTLEVSAARREYSIFENERSAKATEEDELKSKESQSMGQIGELERVYAEKKTRVDRLDESLKDHASREMTISGEIRRDQDRVLLNRERMGELIERQENLLRQIESGKKRLSEFAAEYESLLAQFEAAQKEEGEGLSFLNSVEAEFKTIEEFTHSSERQSEGLRREEIEAASKKNHAMNELAKLRAQIASVVSRIESLEKQKESVIAEKTEAESILGVAMPQGQETGSGNLGLWGSIQKFKEKIKQIFEKASQKQPAQFGDEESLLVESEIKLFADEILKFQDTYASMRERRSTMEGRKAKLDEALTSLLSEIKLLEKNHAGFLANETALLADASHFENHEKELSGAIQEVASAVKARTGEREALLVRLAETRSKQNAFAARREKIEKDKNWILGSKKTQEELEASYEKESTDAGAKKIALESENTSLDAELSRLAGLRDEIVRQTEALRLERESAAAELRAIDSEREENHRVLDGIRRGLHECQMQGAQVGFAIDRLKERIFNAYQVDLVIAASEEESVAEQNLEEVKAEIQKQRDKIAKLGPVNLVAIEEHSEMKSRFEFLTQQEQDLLKAKDDLHKAIIKINRTTRELFVDTFAKIQQHFSEYYKLLFNGGTGELVLLDEQDVLESGIEIIARPPGKKAQSISLLSGGEKALTAVALMFSLFKVKPSPFCVLDEIDAPLDEANVDRFCEVLKQFIVGSQFILITHNKRTMNLADAMYGITMAQVGVSRVVSVKFNSRKDLLAPVQDGRAEATLVSS